MAEEKKTTKETPSLKNDKKYNSLPEALSALQANMKQPAKNGKVGFKDRGGNRQDRTYVRLEDIFKVINDSMNETGAQIFISQETRHRQETNTSYIVTSVYGYNDKIDFIGSEIKIEAGSRMNSQQSIGSALTYARRYSIAMVFCLASEADDDGQSAGDASQKNQSTNRQNHNTQQSYGHTPYQPQPKQQEESPEALLLRKKNYVLELAGGDRSRVEAVAAQLKLGDLSKLNDLKSWDELRKAIAVEIASQEDADPFANSERMPS